MVSGWAKTRGSAPGLRPPPRYLGQDEGPGSGVGRHAVSRPCPLRRNARTSVSTARRPMVAPDAITTGRTKATSPHGAETGSGGAPLGRKSWRGTEGGPTVAARAGTGFRLVGPTRTPGTGATMARTAMATAGGDGGDGGPSNRPLPRVRLAGRCEGSIVRVTGLKPTLRPPRSGIRHCVGARCRPGSRGGSCRIARPTLPPCAVPPVAAGNARPRGGRRAAGQAGASEPAGDAGAGARRTGRTTGRRGSRRPGPELISARRPIAISRISPSEPRHAPRVRRYRPVAAFAAPTARRTRTSRAGSADRPVERPLSDGHASTRALPGKMLTRQTRPSSRC